MRHRDEFGASVYLQEAGGEDQSIPCVAMERAETLVIEVAAYDLARSNSDESIMSVSHYPSR